MKSGLMAIFFFLLSLNVSATVEQDHYRAVVGFVKSDVEWSYFDPILEVQELVVLDEPSVRLERVQELPPVYQVSAKVINFDPDFGPEVGTVECRVELREWQGRWTSEPIKSSCVCQASFVCGEREGRLFEE